MQIRKTSLLLFAFALSWTSCAMAQLTVLNANVPASFAMTGFLQAATLKPGGAPNAGGTLTINNITIIVPDNSVIQMLSHALTWAELFDPKQSAPVFDGVLPPQTTPVVNHAATNSLGQPMTGLALSDAPANATAGTFAGFFPSCELTVTGNIDTSGKSGTPPGSYIAALIMPIAQEIANGGIGFITAIDYAKGRFEVNGTLNTLGTGTLVEINDPVGRYGLAHSPDPRFTADTDNPSVTSGNGYPMGIPAMAPPAIDPDRPLFNRPLNPAPGVTTPFRHDPLLQVGAPLTAFAMPAAAAPSLPASTTPDPWKQVPFMVGDLVAYSGNLYKIDPNASVTPFNPAAPVGPNNRPMNQQFYVSANAVQAARLEVTTAPGSVAGSQGPAYMVVFRTKIGTGGANLTVPANPALGIDGGVIPIPEQRRDISVRGWVTDATQLVDVFAVDVDPTSGAQTPRLLGSVLPEPGFAAGRGNRGRFRFEVGAGSFLPVTRELLVKTQHGQLTLGNQVGLNHATLAGLTAGQFQGPVGEFLVADAPPGFPASPSNFNDFPFLVKGEGNGTISGTNVTVGPLTPFPPSVP
jgi:hypothetical protein